MRYEDARLYFLDEIDTGFYVELLRKPTESEIQKICRLLESLYGNDYEIYVNPVKDGKYGVPDGNQQTEEG